jgi:hypothetical protein
MIPHILGELDENRAKFIQKWGIKIGTPLIKRVYDNNYIIFIKYIPNEEFL